MPSHDKPPHSAGLSTPEFAVLGYLRTHSGLANQVVRHQNVQARVQGLPRQQGALCRRQRQDIHRVDTDSFLNAHD